MYKERGAWSCAGGGPRWVRPGQVGEASASRQREWGTGTKVKLSAEGERGGRSEWKSTSAFA